jgi:hypothetical protein
VDESPGDIAVTSKRVETLRIASRACAGQSRDVRPRYTGAHQRVDDQRSECQAMVAGSRPGQGRCERDCETRIECVGHRLVDLVATRADVWADDSKKIVRRGNRSKRLDPVRHDASSEATPTCMDCTHGATARGRDEYRHAVCRYDADRHSGLAT